MTKFVFAILSAVTIGSGLGVSADISATSANQPTRPVAAASQTSGLLPVEAQNALVAASCVSCHNDRSKAGGLSLQSFDAAKVQENADVAEKMIRKLRANMMPPSTVRNRPDAATLNAFAASLEAPLDRAAALNPNPGRRTFQRLNRAEYARAVRDLLGIDVDVSAFLPGDTFSDGYDNIADVQVFSPTLLQGYLTAASRIATLALGDRKATPTEATYKVPRTQSQMVHVEGTPLGTRGGTSVVHIFPADGEYTFRMMLHSVPTGQLFGSTVQDEQLEVSVDGERVAVLTINFRMRETDDLGMSIVTPRVHVRAGPQRVAVAFVQRFESEVDDLMAPHDHSLADTFIGSDNGITTLPHLRDFAITGPFNVTGLSDTPSRLKVFTCRPATAAEEAPCAQRIIERLATQAFRQPVPRADTDMLMKFFRQGRDAGDFESGIRLAVQRILASPRFLFRFEQAPPTVAAGQAYQIGNLEMASRLSYFLWSAAPDAALLKVAAAGGLRTPASREREVRRMLADPRAEALSTRFAAQWLRLQDVDKILPDPMLFPSYDSLLAQAFKRETELLFDNIVREDHNVLDLLTADYTFVNERIARHYGLPNVTGEAFRRVTLGPQFENRRGILGHGSVLMLTSVANRTSPVSRGKWIMEVLLGTPPPPPPPNVPDFEATKAAVGAKRLSVRERMEEHRANPACASCHRMIDPLGLTLENFDVTGQWRIKDNGVDIDANGELYDGTKMGGPAGLRQAILSHSETVLRNFTENLMRYATGRRVEYFDQPAIRAIVRNAAANDDRFSSFVLGVVESAAFQMNRAETVAETDQSAGGPTKGSRR